MILNRFTAARRILALMVVLLAPAALGFAQEPATARLAFEVATVKRNEYSAPFDQRLGAQNGRFRGLNITLKDLISWAYGLKDYQVSGGPSWIQSERYDVHATTGGIATQSDVRQMLQGLLADRFKLKLHDSTKEMSGFVLSVTPSGPKLKPPTPTARPYQFSTRGDVPGTNVLRGTNVPIGRLVSFVSDRVGSPIDDKTNLTGVYDYILTWSPSFDELDALNVAIAGAGDPAGPSLVTALREQLGLQLERVKTSIQILVVDESQRPLPK